LKIVQNQWNPRKNWQLQGNWKNWR
jgi:hypothetical protein